MKAKVKEWLLKGKVDIFIGYKMVEGHPIPHCFVKDRLAEVDDLIAGAARYPLEKIATALAAENPDVKIGMLARDCTQRALNVLYIWNQLDPDHVKTIPLTCCPSNLKEPVQCSYLKDEDSTCEGKTVGIEKNMDIKAFEALDPEERFKKWTYEFEKCIKCYGCRDICPVCFCKECSLEHPDLVNTGDIPVETPIFHLVRAVHMAGRCIDCGLCEEACPMDIPLRMLYRKVNQIVSDVFDYHAGTSPSESPFNIVGERLALEPRPIREV
jgi:ferredoxin